MARSIAAARPSSSVVWYSGSSKPSSRLLAEKGSLLLGHAQEAGDHPQRQLGGDVGDEVDPLSLGGRLV
jgi:hypothetical protein